MTGGEMIFWFMVAIISSIIMGLVAGIVVCILDKKSRLKIDTNSALHILREEYAKAQERALNSLYDTVRTDNPNEKWLLEMYYANNVGIMNGLLFGIAEVERIKKYSKVKL